MSSFRRTLVACGGLVLIVAGAAAVILKIHASRNPTETATVISGYVSILLLVVGVAPSLLIWWWRGRSARVARQSTPEQLDAAADMLAEQVASRWRREAIRRRIVTPGPIPVEWRWAGDAVAAPMLEIAERLPPGVGVSELPGYDGLPVAAGSGVVTNLHDELYARLPHGRLVILGTPGAGKTAAMILLLLAALERRRARPETERPQVPVPVWLSLGSWNPARSSLHSWVVTTLGRDYPALRAPEYGPSAAGELLHSCRVALFLDGLDELPEAARTRALMSLSEHSHGLRVVLTSRSSEYRHAILVALDHAAVVQLRPVQLASAARYLLHEQAGSRRLQWANVGNFITENPDSGLARALSNPFAVSLARDSFAEGDPTVLIDEKIFPTVKAIYEHLITRLLAVAYPDGRERSRAIRWLAWMARRMGSHRDLAWWQVTEWVPKSQLRVVCGLVSGLALALGFMAGEYSHGQSAYGATAEIGISLGFLAGCITAVKPVTKNPRSFAFELGRFARFWEITIFPPPSVTRGAFIVGLAVGLPVGIINGFYNKATSTYFASGLIGHGAAFLLTLLVIGIPVMIGAVVLGSAVSWLERLCTTPIVDSPSVTAAETYRADRQVSLALGVVPGAMIASIFFIFASGSIITRVAFALFLGIGFGVCAGFSTGMVPLLKSAELMLACRGLGFIRLQRLLEDASDRQLLRQVGAIYQFRHYVIQDHLAAISDITSPTRSVVIAPSKSGITPS